MNILILAASPQSGEKRDGDYPLCLTEFDGIPLIERIVSSCKTLTPTRMIFALREQDVRKHHLDNIVMLLAANATVLNVRAPTAGAACTALLAAGMIDNDEALLILSSNELIDADFAQIVQGFASQNADAGVVTFPSIHPRYSYVRLEHNGCVSEAAEKNPISRHAVASFYWFRHGKDFVRAAKNSIRKDANVDGAFFIAPTLNELVLEQKKIAVHPLEARHYHPLKTERQVGQYETALGSGRAA